MDRLGILLAAGVNAAGEVARSLKDSIKTAVNASAVNGSAPALGYSILQHVSVSAVVVKLVVILRGRGLILILVNVTALWYQ